MNSLMPTPISERRVPSVAGLDLEHALNYVSARGLPVSWFYESFTYPRTFYKPGSRPALEMVLERRSLTGATGLCGLSSIVKAVYDTVVHFSLIGKSGVANRGLTEEGILLLGQGWCNEQARVLAALCQIAGYPARLVFGGLPTGKGHVVTEVYCEGKWVLVDQTAAYVFKGPDGSGLNVHDFRQGGETASFASAQYREALQAERRKAPNLDFWDEYVSYGNVDDPLQLFYSLGYCNYFIH